jgi:hypothetical protein
LDHALDPTRPTTAFSVAYPAASATHHRGSQAASDSGRALGVTMGAEHRDATVQRLRPLKVLLAMRDRRYMRVTDFLLQRRGYDVVQEGGTGIAEAAARFRVDVVVLEPDSSRGETSRVLTALAALPAPPAVIAVASDGRPETLPGLMRVPKWAPVEELARDIDAASLRRAAPLAQESSRS